MFQLQGCLNIAKVRNKEGETNLCHTPVPNCVMILQGSFVCLFV